MRGSPHSTGSSKPSSSVKGHRTSSSSSSSDSVKTQRACCSSRARQTHLSSGGVRKSVETSESTKNVSAEKKPGKTAEHNSVMDPPKENSELTHQNHSAETDSADRRHKEMVKCKGKKRQKDEAGKSAEEEIYLIKQSPNKKTDEETEKEPKQDVRSEIHITEPEMSHNVDQGDLDAKTSTVVGGEENAADDHETSEIEEAHRVRDECLTAKPDKRTSASEPEDRRRSSVRRERSAKQFDSQTKYNNVEADETDEVICGDTVEDGSVTKRSAKTSTTGSKQHKTQNTADPIEPSITTRSTREGRKTTSGEGKEDKTPTRRRNTPAKDSKEQNRKEARQSEDETSAKGTAPKSSEQKPSQQTSEEEDGEAATTRTRGQAKKTAKPTPGETDGAPFCSSDTRTVKHVETLLICPLLQPVYQPEG